MGGSEVPKPICGTTGSYIDAGTLCLHLSPLPGPLGTRAPSLIGPLQLVMPPPPTFQQSSAQTQSGPPPKLQPPPPPPQGSLQQQVKTILEADNFDVPLVVDDADKAAGPKSRCFFSTIPGVSVLGYPVNTPPELTTLDAVTDVVYHQLVAGSKNLKREDVLAAVSKVYLDKLKENEDRRWQFVISMLYAPQVFFWSNQTIPSYWQNGYQLTLGANYRGHPYGKAGWEHGLLLQLSGSSFNLTDPDWFQNALAVYQAAYVAPLGHEFRFLGAPGLWANLQGSIFGQVAAGTGSSGENTVHLGFMAQVAGGGQIALNIGWLQIVVNDQIVQSWVVPVPVIGTSFRPLSTLGNQFGLGIGGQF
ncbi:MAG TPA: hypothetical protein VL523_00100 [Terriglobia bacterium]|nr:hypothetical protein [Terriglobia bacterium]